MFGRQLWSTIALAAGRLDRGKPIEIEMTKGGIKANQRGRRSQVFGLILLVLVQVAQPVLALSGAGCGPMPPDHAPRACCCAAEASLDAVAKTEDHSERNCCSTANEEDSLGVDKAVVGKDGDGATQVDQVDSIQEFPVLVSPLACSCRMDPAAPLPPTVPTPMNHRQVIGGNSPAEWVRSHAEYFGRFLTGLAFLGSRNKAFPGSIGRVPAWGHGGEMTPWDRSDRCNWFLLGRGVKGLLADLSVDRN